MMSASEAGMMSGRQSFGVTLQKVPSSNSQPGMQTMILAFSSDGTEVYKPIATTSPTTTGGSSSNANVSHGSRGHMSDPVRRKRGRPRKYGPDGSITLGLTPAPAPLPSLAPATLVPAPPPAASALALVPAPSPAATALALVPAPNPPPAAAVAELAPAPPAVPPVGLPSSPPPSVAAAASASSMKKARGRPPGKKQQIDAPGSAGIELMPHVITVKVGEDVSSRIMSLGQHGPRTVCILSANGAISNVTLRQAATSGGTVTYEGRFEIVSLSGSFVLSESGAQRSRTGGLSISLAGPDGRVLGGVVAGLLTAATPVQVVVVSFMADGPKELETFSPKSKLILGSGEGRVASPQSRANMRESSGEHGSSSGRALELPITATHNAW